MKRVRSGSHLERIGDTWYYRRVVPPDARDVIGKRTIRVSLRTTSHVEAMRLEKNHDVDFETRLHAARASGCNGYPKSRAERVMQFSEKIFKETEGWRDENPQWHTQDWSVGLLNPQHLNLGLLVKIRGQKPPNTWLFKAAPIPQNLLMELIEYVRNGRGRWTRELVRVPPADRQEVEQTLGLLASQAESTLDTLDKFWFSKLRESLFLLSCNTREAWQETEAEFLELVRKYSQSRSDPTIDWAFEEWLKTKHRPRQTQDEARRYIDHFKKITRLRTLTSIRRRHVTDWRDKLREAGDLAPKSINHRLEIVSAILRTGWREAEIATPPDLARINVPEPVSNRRRSWSRTELLGALAALEPRSWSAWVFVVALTTGTRIGEPIAAVKEWYDFATGCIKVPAESTKMKKEHALPIIELIREPLAEHISMLPAGAYMFNAPRPANAKLKISHEASKWYGRFFDRHKIVDRVFHELRDTWIETARESTVKKDIYEIITGHSPKTGSDPYGGEKPHVLMAANEEVCRQLLDPEMVVAVRRLVG